MRISTISQSNTPSINHVTVMVTHDDTTLVSMNIAIGVCERNETSMHRIAETVEYTVRRLLKDFFPGLRGVRTVIYV